MQAIIFLDFDGVMLTDPNAVSQNLTHSNYLTTAKFDTECVENLLDLIHSTGAEIVLSTSWADGTPFSQLASLLLRNGIDPGYLFEYDDPSLGGYMTPREAGGARWEAITQWLQEHDHVTRWVAIDDINLTGTLPGHAVLTDPRKGLDKKALAKAKRILSQSPS